MKGYTDIEQSKKLAEILPLESADMYYKYILPKSDKIHHVPEIGNPINSLKWYNEGYTFSGKRKPITLNDYCIPCWSLAALLGVIPKRIKDYNVLRTDIDENTFAMWYDEIGYGVNNDLPNITTESAVDTCYEIIIKLKEKELL